MNFKGRLKPQNPESKKGKKAILNNLYALFKDSEKVLDAFESGIFPMKIECTSFSNLDTRDKVSAYSDLKILTPK